MRIYDKPQGPNDREAGRGDYDAPSPRKEYYQQDATDLERKPLRSFKAGKVGWSIWPSWNDPEQPKFNLDGGGYRNDRTGAWENRRSFFYNEAVILYRTLHQALKWVCEEAGVPMPLVEEAPSPYDQPRPPQPQYREPGDMGGSNYQQGRVGEQEYQANRRYPEQRYQEPQSPVYQEGPRMKPQSPNKDDDLPPF